MHEQKLNIWKGGVCRWTNTLSGGFCVFMYVAPSAFYRFFLPDWIVCPVCMFLINAHHNIKRAEGPRGFRAVSMKELPASLMWNGLPSDLVTSKKIGQSGRLYRRAYDETNGKWELIDKILHVAFFIWLVSFFFCFFLFLFFLFLFFKILDLSSLVLKWCHARSLCGFLASFQ